MFKNFFQPNFPAEQGFTGRDPDIKIPSTAQVREWYEGGTDFIGNYSEYKEQYPGTPNINFEKIEAIFSDYAKHVGVSDEKIQIDVIPPERIFLNKADLSDFATGETMTGGVADMHSFMVIACDDEGNFVVASRAKNWLEKKGSSEIAKLSPQQIKVIETLRLMIHEQLHELSGTNQSRSYSLQASGNTSGLNRKTTDGLGFLTPSSGLHLDEGVTDYLTFDVLREYVRREGEFEGVTVRDIDRYVELNYRQDWRRDILGYETPSYSREIRIVRLLIHGLASTLEVAPEEIKKAFIRAKLRSGEIFSDELRMYFKKAGLIQVYSQLEQFNKQNQQRENHDRKDKRFSKLEPALKEIVPKDIYDQLSEGWDVTSQ